jgi:hypothetical protein
LTLWERSGFNETPQKAAIQSLEQADPEKPPIVVWGHRVLGNGVDQDRLEAEIDPTVARRHSWGILERSPPKLFHQKHLTFCEICTFSAGGRGKFSIFPELECDDKWILRGSIHSRMADLCNFTILRTLEINLLSGTWWSHFQLEVTHDADEANKTNERDMRIRNEPIDCFVYFSVYDVFTMITVLLTLMYSQDQ